MYMEMSEKQNYNYKFIIYSHKVRKLNINSWKITAFLDKIKYFGIKFSFVILKMLEPQYPFFAEQFFHILLDQHHNLFYIHLSPSINNCLKY